MPAPDDWDGQGEQIDGPSPAEPIRPSGPGGVHGPGDHQGQSQGNRHWNRTSCRETAALQDGEQQGPPIPYGCR